MDKEILADKRGEQVLVGVMLIKQAGGGGAPPKNHQELAAFKQRLETLIVLTSQDDPELEEEARRCYRAALHNQEPLGEIIQRVKDLAAQRSALGIPNEMRPSFGYA